MLLFSQSSLYSDCTLPSQNDERRGLAACARHLNAWYTVLKEKERYRTLEVGRQRTIHCAARKSIDLSKEVFYTT
jgi:hypothetical protein